MERKVRLKIAFFTVLGLIALAVTTTGKLRAWPTVPAAAAAVLAAFVVQQQLEELRRLRASQPVSGVEITKVTDWWDQEEAKGWVVLADVDGSGASRRLNISFGTPLGFFDFEPWTIAYRFVPPEGVELPKHMRGVHRLSCLLEDCPASFAFDPMGPWAFTDVVWEGLDKGKLAGKWEIRANFSFADNLVVASGSVEIPPMVQ